MLRLRGETEKPLFTPQQVEQLLKLIPSTSGGEKGGYDTDEEIETGFAGMIYCCYSTRNKLKHSFQ